MANEFDSYRPPREERKRIDGARKRRRKRIGAGAQDGSREERMVPNVEFDTYYGRPVVKAPPWEWPIATYLFLGGVAGGSSLLGVGAAATGRTTLRRNARISSIAAAGLGSLALIEDLGKPSRFLNMFRVFKLSSPMSWGSWLLGGYSSVAAAAAVSEIDKATGRRLPIPAPLRPLLDAIATPAGVMSGMLGAPLAVYTAILFGDTSVPAWSEGRKHLPYLFVSSASAAAGGLALVTTPTHETGPARALAVTGAVGEIAVTQAMATQMDPVSHEPFTEGKAGRMLKAAEWLTVAGGVGAALGGRNRVVAAVSGTALLAASALTRFGVLEAGLESTKDPKYVIEPQKRRLADRRAGGAVDDSITTAG